MSRDTSDRADGDGPSTTKRVAIGALALAAVAVALELRSMFQAPTPCDCPHASVVAPPAASAARSDGGVSNALWALDARVTRLEGRGQATGEPAASPLPTAEPSATAAAPIVGSAAAPGGVRYKSLSAATGGVTVRQEASGIIRAETFDRSLAGSTIVVVGQRDDGTTDQIPVALGR